MTCWSIFGIFEYGFDFVEILDSEKINFLKLEFLDPVQHSNIPLYTYFYPFKSYPRSWLKTALILQDHKKVLGVKWHLGAWLCSVKGTAEFFASAKISPRNLNHMREYLSMGKGDQMGQNHGQTGVKKPPKTVPFKQIKLNKSFFTVLKRLPCLKTCFFILVKSSGESCGTACTKTQLEFYTDQNPGVHTVSMHRRRMETEAKAKVVASVWGQNVFNSWLAVFPRSIWTKKLNSSFSFKSTEAKHLSR